MPSETITATPDWTALQGTILDGGYEISECLLANSASASFRIRVLGDRSTHAVVNVFTSEAATLEQYALWQDALELRHPNISSPVTVGRLNWKGDLYPYVVLYKADENLAGVILERPLTAPETREVLRSVGAGLEHLHANGFVHSAVLPEHVLAIGDSIKISSTSLRRINTALGEGEPDAGYLAPESGTENLTVTADIWCLGATLFEVLTQKKFGEDGQEQTKSLPTPFDWIVERCTASEPHDRATLSEIFAILSGAVKRPLPPPEPAPEAAKSEPAVIEPVKPEAEKPEAPKPEIGKPEIVRPQPVRSGAARPQPGSPSLVSGAPPSPGQKPARPFAAAAAAPAPTSSSRLPEWPRPKLTTAPKPVYSESRPRQPQFTVEKPQESPRIKFLSYAFLAIVLAGGLLWLARPKPEKPHTTVNPAARTQTAAPASAPIVVPPPAGPSQAPSTQAGTSPVTPHSASPAPSGQHQAWKVVVFTFYRKQDADERAKALAAKHPGFTPEVFSRTDKGPFLIVLGGGSMTREQANQLRTKARSAGFPRDSYVLNFNR